MSKGSKKQGKLFLWFCDPGRSINVISVTTVTVTQEGGGPKNHFLLSKTLHFQEICRPFAMCVKLKVSKISRQWIVAERTLGQPFTNHLHLPLLKFISKKKSKYLCFHHLMQHLRGGLCLDNGPKMALSDSYCPNCPNSGISGHAPPSAAAAIT